MGVSPHLPEIWDRVRPDLAAAGNLALAAHRHDDHPAGPRRGIRGVRARPGRRRQPADTPLRPAVRNLLLRARRRRAGRLSPAGAGRDNPRAVGCYHHRVLPAGPGPRDGDHARAHAARRRDGHGARTRRSRGPAPRPVRGPGPRGPGPVRSGPGGRHERERSAAPNQADVPLGSRRCRPGQAACSRDREGRYRPGPPARREADRRRAARLAASPARGRRTRLQRGPERPRANGQR
jgi:hypothetical protein